MPPQARPARIWMLILAASALQAGCGASNPVLSSGPRPRVEDCMLLQQVTPTRYICDGKAYTAVQLADLRKGAGNSH